MFSMRMERLTACQVGAGGGLNDVCGGSLAHNGLGLAEVHMNRDFSQRVLSFGSGVDAVAFQRAFALSDAFNSLDDGIHGAVACRAVFKFLCLP